MTQVQVPHAVVRRDRRRRFAGVVGAAALTLSFVAVVPGDMAFAAGSVAVDRTDDTAAATACTAAANDCSLRGATIFANANPGTTINVPAGTYQLTIDGNSEAGNCGDATLGDLDIAGNTTSIVGAGAATTVIRQTMPNDRVICVDQNLVGGFNFSISGVTITGGRETHGVGGGGMIAGATSDVTTVTNVVFDDNRATGTGSPVGGALASGKGTLNVTGSTFTNNQSAGSGGAIYYSALNAAGTLTVGTSTFTTNASTGGNGGAILGSGTSATHTISKSTFAGNTAPGTGGAVADESGTMSIDHSTFVTNSVTGTGRGGAIGSIDGAGHNVTITFSRLIGNTAAALNGSALYGGTSSAMTADQSWGSIPGGAAFAAGAVTLTNNLDLGITFASSPLVTNQSVGVSAKFSSPAGQLSAADAYTFVGLPVAFSATNGTVNGASTTLPASGIATATFTTTKAHVDVATQGFAGVTVDGETRQVPTNTAAAVTTTAVTSDSPDPSAMGASVTVGYTVTGAQGNTPTAPAGNVTVSDGVDSCTASVVAGQCALTLSTSGSRTLTAVYAGDANFSTSASTGSGHTVNPPVVVTPIMTEILTASHLHTCGLQPDGTADCWGSNTYGQATDQPGPYTQLTAGSYHTCGLRPDGSADCWGRNDNGQATDQTGPYTQLTGGGSHTCGLKTDGSADCWGDNTDGQATDQTGPYTQLTAGFAHTCGLRANGSADCWGLNATNHTGPYTQLTTGYEHTCGLTTLGAADCWGTVTLVDYGQATGRPGPYIQLTAGMSFNCGLTPAGATDCWGNGNAGQLGSRPGPYTQLTTGFLFICGLTTSGAADCWGYNVDGQATNQAGPYGPYVPPPAPSVTIDQASGQADPTSTAPVHFTAVFSAPVTGFATGDVTLSGSANATTGTVTEVAPNDGTTYDVAVTGMTTDGTVIATVAANTAKNIGGVGNIASTSTDNTVSFTGIDATPPTVVSITRDDPSPTGATTVSYTVTFSETVTGVDSADFALTTTGVSGASITNVAGSGATRTVTVSTGTGSGTIRLDLTDNDTIVDAATNPLDGTGTGSTTSGQVYTIDRTSPNLTLAKTHTGTFAQGQTGATYSITVANSGDGAATGTLSVVDTLPVGLTATAIAGSGWSCTLATLTCTHPGPVVAAGSLPALTVTVTVAANAGALVTNRATLTGGPLAAALVADDPTTVTPVDSTPPTVASITRDNTSPTALATVNYTVTFSETVTGVDTGDFSLTTTGVSGTAVTTVAGSGATRTVTVSTGTGSGTIRLDLIDDDTIVDTAANRLGGTGTGNGSFNTGETYAINRTAPNLTLTKSHVGSFSQGQTGAAYAITITNTGDGAATGTLTMVDTLPVGLTATAIAGSGWSCTLATGTCTHPGPVPSAGSLPAVAVIVNVAANAPASVTNRATLSGGPLAASLIADDPTTITPVVVGPTVGLIADPCVAGKTALLVTGTGAAEYVHLKGGEHGRVKVSINSVVVGTYAPTGTIIVNTQGGTDRIVVESEIKLAQLLFGGDGTDSVQSGQGRAVIVGGQGDDKLNGYTGRDIIIGGTGADTIAGRDGEDILIAGPSIYDDPTTANMVSLCAIHNEWARTDAAYATRVGRIGGTSAGGLNGLNTLRAGLTVIDDTHKDTLQGDGGTDWYIANRIPPGATLDTLNGRANTETVTEL